MFTRKKKSSDSTNVKLVAPTDSVDSKLRRFGYTIHSRPEDGEPIWKKNRVLFTQREALLRVDYDLKQLELQFANGD